MSTMFTSKPNLNQRATVAVVAALWNQKAIYAILENMWALKKYHIAEWRTVEDKIAVNVEMLPLPMTAKENIANLIQPMGAQIIKWMEFHFSLSPHLPEKFCWTERGAIDFFKTAKDLLRHKDMNVMVRYRLVCTYCIEEEILLLWPVVQTRVPKELYEMAFNESELVLYWSCLLKGELEKYMDMIEYCGGRSPFEFGFLAAMRCGYDWAVQFFMQRLDFFMPARKAKVILAAARKLVDRLHQKPSILLLLLSAMYRERQDELFASYSCGVLASFVMWPYQDFFMEVADKVWNTLSDAHYLIVLEELARTASVFHKSDIYYNLFRDFWNASPVHYKKYTISKCINGTFLSRLFIVGKTDGIIKLIFEEANADEKREMIFYFEGMNTCDTLIVKGRWKSLEMFVQECILSKHNMERFNVEYLEHVRLYSNQKLTSSDVNSFLSLLNTLTEKLAI